MTSPADLTTNGHGVLGHLDWDPPAAVNERVVLRTTGATRTKILRHQFVRIEDANGSHAAFLGRIVAGPFFPGRESAGTGVPLAEAQVLAEIEVQGELIGGRPLETCNRPAPGSVVRVLTADEIRDMLGCTGDMMLGTLSGRDDLPVCLNSKSKSFLPRNVGVFGTVGSGKSNTAQVLIEEAAAHGWAVIVVDVEGEYVAMDGASTEEALHGALGKSGRPPAGVADFQVHHPASCGSERAESNPFTLRLADFEMNVVVELTQATQGERNALLECVDYFQGRAGNRLVTTEAEALHGLLDPSPQAQLPYTLRMLRDRASERSSRTSDQFDYQGLAVKLLWLIRSGAIDQPNMKSLDAKAMITPGRITVIDVSVANDTIKNLVTADLLRKTFAYKLAHADAPPTLLVIEEAHSFISREKVHTMQATLQMLRNVTRRGRKRWLATAFVSQQPGHLPPEIFELCNTRIVHTLRSMHNLDALMTTTSDISRELWSRCPLLGTGEAIISSPQFKCPITVTVRPASSRRKFVR
jgi:uncharacterized protein